MLRLRGVRHLVLMDNITIKTYLTGKTVTAALLPAMS
jgi:hypothetical protein